METTVSTRTNMKHTESSKRMEKEITRKQLCSRLKECLNQELITLKMRKQIIEELEALDR
jgi:hypothetical protein